MKRATPAGLVLALCIVAFAALKIPGLHYDAVDENIYFYLAHAMTAGALPYRDFFHAHPPLHLLPLATAYELGGGYSLLPARWLAALSIVGAAFAISRVSRRPFAWPAVIGAGVFLLSYDVLRISTHFNGTNLAAFWVALGLERLCRRRDLQAAAAFCLGGFTMLIAAPAAVGAALVLMVVEPRRGLALALYGAVGFLASNAVAYGVFGSSYLEQVYLFHLAKAESTRQTAAVFASALKMNSLLFAGAAMGLIAWLLDALHADEAEDPATAAPQLTGLRAELLARLPLALSLGATLGSLCFLLWANRIFTYYLQVLFVGLAPLAGAGFVAFGVAVRDGATKGAPRLPAAVLSFLLVAGLLPSWIGGEGSLEPGVVHYLRHESKGFDSAPTLAEGVREHCAQDTTVFGDANSAPLVALLADRQLTLGEADTNQMRFRSGHPSPADFIARLEAAPPCAVVLRENRGLFRLAEFSRWLTAHYTPILELRSEGESNHYTLLTRRTEP